MKNYFSTTKLVILSVDMFYLMTKVPFRSFVFFILPKKNRSGLKNIFRFKLIIFKMIECYLKTINRFIEVPIVFLGVFN
jgi:hypothetical protein